MMLQLYTKNLISSNLSWNLRNLIWAHFRAFLPHKPQNENFQKHFYPIFSHYPVLASCKKNKTKNKNKNQKNSKRQLVAKVKKLIFCHFLPKKKKKTPVQKVSQNKLRQFLAFLLLNVIQKFWKVPCTDFYFWPIFGPLWSQMFQNENFPQKIT